MTACAFDENLYEMGWYCLTNQELYGPRQVKQKNENPWGFFDMHGNVSEWSQDWFSIYPETDAVDPTGPESAPNPGAARVTRGGSYLDQPWLCRSAKRFFRVAPRYHRLQGGPAP